MAKTRMTRAQVARSIELLVADLQGPHRHRQVKAAGKGPDSGEDERERFKRVATGSEDILRVVRSGAKEWSAERLRFHYHGLAKLYNRIEAELDIHPVADLKVARANVRKGLDAISAGIEARPGTGHRGKLVRMEDPAMKELGYAEYSRRSFHGIPLKSVFKSKSTGKRYEEGDLQLARMVGYVHRVGTVLDLGGQQINSAIYLFQKYRKADPRVIGDFDTAAHVLLYLAGRQLGLSQRSSRFMAPGKERRFNRYLLDFGGKLDVRPRQLSEAEIMAAVNEVAVQLSYPPVTKGTVHEALLAVAGRPATHLPLWTFAYHVSRHRGGKWPGKALGKKRDVAKAFGVKAEVLERLYYIAAHTETGKPAPPWLVLHPSGGHGR